MTPHLVSGRTSPRSAVKTQPRRRPPRRAAPQRRRLFFESLEDRQLLAAFTPGNFVAVQVGADASPSALTFAATTVFLKEFTPTGTFVQSIAMPTSAVGGQRALTAQGTGVSEGLITLSGNSEYLLLTGYDAVPGTTNSGTALSTSPSSTIKRVVGRLDSAGSVDTSTVLQDFSGGNIRSVVSTNGTDLWVSGSGTSGGVRFGTFGQTPPATTTALNTTVTTTRALGIFGNQLYVSAQTGTLRMATVGSGLPTTGSQAIANLPGAAIGTIGEPYQFFLADLTPTVAGNDTLFVADESAFGLGGYIRKFSLVSGAWVANGNIGVPNTGARGLVGKVEAGVVTLFVSETEPTSTAAGGNSIRKLVDATGYNASVAGASLTLLVSGVTNTAFRGLAFVPQPAIVPNPVINAGSGGNHIVVSQSGANVVVTVDGTQVFSQALASTLSLTINGQDGADTLTVDYVAGGFFNLPISYGGGNPPASPGDKLEILGGTFTTVATTHTGSSSGNVNLDGTVISYTGIEPLLIDTDLAANFQFNLPATADTLELKQQSGAELILDSTTGTFEDTTFDTTGASSIVVNLGAGNDSFNLSPLGLYAGSVTVNGEAGDDTLTANFSGGLAVPAGGANFSGGGQVTGDLVRVLGSGTETATYTPSGTTSGSGTVLVEGRTLTFTGLEPLDIVGMATANVLFPNGDDVIDIVNGATFDGTLSPAMIVSGTSGGVAFETVALRNNTAVSINTTTVEGAPDLISITSADNPHGNGSLTITTGAGAGDMIDIHGGLNFPGTVSLTSQQIDFNDATSVITATTVGLDAGGGSITNGAPPASVVATTLIAVAAAGIALDTNVASLSAVTTNAGAAINITETNAVTLTNVVTNSGPITVNAGGTVTADNVNASAANVTVTVTGGSLISGAADGNAPDILGNTLSLSVTGAGNDLGAGAGARLEINAVTLSASTGGAAGDDMFLDDRSGDLALGLVDAGAGTVDLRSVGAITDANGGLNNIAASQLALRTASGIGSADPLETAVSTLAAVNLTSGGIRVDNSAGGLLSIGTVNGLAGIANAVPGPGGLATITNASPVTVAANMSAGGAITVTASESAGADNLAIEAGVSIGSTGSSVTLNAGDNATVEAGALLAALTTVTINIDSGNADPAGAMLLIDSTADIDAASATLSGNTDNDIFTIAPDDDTSITVNGDAPVTFPGDALHLDISGLTSPAPMGFGPGDGVWTFGNAAEVAYNSIEEVTPPPVATCSGLVLDMNGGLAAGPAADSIVVQVNGANLEVLVNGALAYSGSQSTIDSLTVKGSGDVDALTIQETAFGLPAFCEPGSGPAGGHTSATFTSLTGYDQGGATPVDIHFDGGGGEDHLLVNILTSNSLVYTSDNLDTNRSGNVGIGGSASLTTFGTRQLGISFENVTNLSFDGGAGSSLIADGSSSPAASLTSLTISAGLNSADSITEIASDGSFAQTAFIQHITGLLVRSGQGSDTIDLKSLDTLGSLYTEILLDGDSLANNDTASDTIRVQSTSGLAAIVSLLAGAGNDSFQVQSNPLGGDLGGIAGAVLVSPTSGSFADDPGLADSDSLVVSDVGDPTGDSVVILNSSIEGITGCASAPDIEYRNIDVLDVTGTSGDDVLDSILNSGSDLDTVTVHGAGGADQFYLDLNSGNQTDNAVAGLLSVTLNGNAGSDTFGEAPGNAPVPPTPAPLVHPVFPLGKGKIQPSTTTLITINGGSSSVANASPVNNATSGNSVGDLLNLDLSGAAAPAAIAVVSTVAGLATVTGFQNVNFSDIEAIHLCDQTYLTRVEMGDLYVRSTEAADTLQFSLTNSPNLLRVRINTTFQNLLATRKTVAYGRGGNDTIQQTNVLLDCEFHGQDGDDYLTGYFGDDLLVGGYGKDRLLASEGDNELWGDVYPTEDFPLEKLTPAFVGDLRIDNDDQLSAGNGSDIYYGQGGNDTISAGGGDDYAQGGSGPDNLAGGNGNDRLYGGEGHDVIGGDAGDDLLAGNAGNDKLYGRLGNDLLIGGEGADQIYGNEGNDLMVDGIVYQGAIVPPLQPTTIASDDSRCKGDHSDQLMAALLTDWALNSLLDDPLLLALARPQDTSIDILSGDTGTDRASPGQSPLDTGNWESSF